MKIFVEIPARGGSKGVPGKALQDLGGKPLIAWTIEHALSIENAAKVFVNTDSSEIRDVAIRYGAEVPFLRPQELATDHSPLDQATRYALSWYRDNENFSPDIFILMSPTNPFRRRGLINEALRIGYEDKSIFNISSVAPVENNLANYWQLTKNKVERFAFPYTCEDEPMALCQSSMSFNIVFERREACQNCRVPTLLNRIESIDIDEQKDLELARMVIEEGLWNE